MASRAKPLPCRHCCGSGVEPDNTAIGQQMRRLRMQAKLTLREIARRMEVSAPYVSDLELGRRHWGPKATVKYNEALER